MSEVWVPALHADNPIAADTLHHQSWPAASAAEEEGINSLSMQNNLELRRELLETWGDILSNCHPGKKLFLAKFWIINYLW